VDEFVCKRCGRCCGLVPWEKSEYKAVMKTARRMRVTFVKEHVQGRTVYFVRSIVKKASHGVENMKLEDMVCPFMDKNEDGTTFCKVYEYRPMMCQRFGIDWEKGELMVCPKDERPEVKNRHDKQEANNDKTT